MLDLKGSSGLPVFLDGSALVFGRGMVTIQPSERTLDEVKPFLMDSEAVFEESVAYHMYRNAGFLKDIGLLNKNHLRYDLTVINSGKIGQEFVKTIGHYHPFKPGTNQRFPEIYQVLSGRAIFVLQKVEVDDSKVEAVYLVHASAPEKAVMPSGCGHVTVNIGSQPLVLANVVSDKFSSRYDTYRRMRGAAYYVLDREGKSTLRPNRLYGSLPEPRIMKPKRDFLGLSGNQPLYTAVADSPNKFRWLNFPEEFRSELEVDRLFDNITI